MKVTIKTVELTKAIARQLPIVDSIPNNMAETWQKEGKIIGRSPYLAEKGIRSLIVEGPSGEAVLMSDYMGGLLFGYDAIRAADNIVLER